MTQFSVYRSRGFVVIKDDSGKLLWRITCSRDGDLLYVQRQAPELIRDEDVKFDDDRAGVAIKHAEACR